MIVQNMIFTEIIESVKRLPKRFPYCKKGCLPSISILAALGRKKGRTSRTQGAGLKMDTCRLIWSSCSKGQEGTRRIPKMHIGLTLCNSDNLFFRI